MKVQHMHPTIMREITMYESRTILGVTGKE